MRLESFLNRHHVSVLLLLTCFYLAVEAVYAVRMPLGHDEFQGGHEVKRVLERTPYRDYQPYKTVGGYYLQSLALLAAPTPWSGLIFIRAQQALLTAATILLAALWLRRFYRPAAICLAYALLVTMSTFLERSAELRVDMLTGLFGLLSLLLLIDQRLPASGLLAGASLAISQKGALYVLAGGFALGVAFLVRRDRVSWRRLLVFGAACAVPLLLYVGFWCAVTSPEDVFRTTFRQPTMTQAAFVSYEETAHVRPTFWAQTLRRNPFFYGLALWALVGLLRRTESSDWFSRRRLLFNYGAALFLLMLLVKQPWPYNFVLLIPTLFLLHVDALDRFLEEGRGWRGLAAAYLVLGLALPLSRFPTTFARDNGFQKHMFELADAMLEPDERYLAGCHYLYHTHRHARRLAYISEYTSDAVHRMSSAEIAATIASLEEDRLKLLIHAHTFRSLPERLQLYLRSRFARLWGNVFIYAPQVGPGQSHVDLEFGGQYLLDGPGDAGIVVDGESWPERSLVELSAGRHEIRAAAPFRFKLIPSGLRELAQPEYRDMRELYPETSEY